MKKIAIIGYGVVGGGITAVLEANAEKIESDFFFCLLTMDSS